MRSQKCLAEQSVLAIRDAQALGVEVARQHTEKDAPKRCQAQSYFSRGDLTGRQAIVAFIKAQPQMTPKEWEKWQAMSAKDFMLKHSKHITLSMSTANRDITLISRY